LKLLKADIIVNDVHIDGLIVRLNYENKREFNYIELYDDIKKTFLEKYAKYGFIRNIEMCSIAIENRSIRLKLDLGNIELNKIVLKSSLFDCHNSRFTGDLVLLKDRTDNMEDIIISYHVGKAEKEIKTVI
jgi:ribosomal protein S8